MELIDWEGASSGRAKDWAISGQLIDRLISVESRGGWRDAAATARRLSVRYTQYDDDEESRECRTADGVGWARSSLVNGQSESSGRGDTLLINEGKRMGWEGVWP